MDELKIWTHNMIGNALCDFHSQKHSTYLEQNSNTCQAGRLH